SVTGISSRDGETFPLVREAGRAVTQSDQRGLLHVIDELRREDTAIARNIADHIDSFTDYDFAHLLFSDGSVSNAISLDNQLNIIQVRSEEHTSELQSRFDLVCRLLLEKKKIIL